MFFWRGRPGHRVPVPLCAMTDWVINDDEDIYYGIPSGWTVVDYD